ncbi:MAG: acyltransferase [Eubacteriales bacterium]|nr:acyltransferase [Eubacteriales bacterium]
MKGTSMKMNNSIQKTSRSSNLIRRNVSIDILECIAIFLVLIYHSTLYSNDFINHPSFLYYIRYYLTTFLSPCVCLFFFANGYLLLNKKFNLNKHIRKTIRLVVLTALWSIIKIIILMPIKNEYLSLSEFVKAVWTRKFGWIESLWFLGSLVGIYLIFPILKSAYDNNRKCFLYFTAVVTILTFGNKLLNECGTAFLTLILHKNIALQDLNFFNMFNPFGGIHGYPLVYFCLGGYACRIEGKIKAVPALKRNVISTVIMAVCGLGLWAVGLLYSYTNNSIRDVVWNGYDTVFTLGIVLCIYVLCLNYKKNSRIVRLISCNTLGIYFIHELFIKATQGYIKSFQFFCNIPCTMLYALLILFISLGITLIMKKIPVLRQLV